MRTSHFGKRLVVITAGDPSGIGPEIILKSLAKPSILNKAIPVVIGDYGIFQKTAKVLKIDISHIKPGPFKNFTIKKRGVAFIDLNNVSLRKFRFGIVDQLYGKASMEYLLRGVSIVRSIEGASLVTAPINKASINRAGFRFAGHTEFLSHITKSPKVTMMLISDSLRVSLVTRHVAFKDVTKFMNKSRVIQTIENTDYALKRFFKISHPKIGIAGLNPHASDGGLLGKEENSVILPAVNYLKRKIKGISGLYPADILFYKAYRGEFDAVVCMYHDQGLIPLKMIAFDKGVNLTIGLPFIRTSPDHGTGFDIAGKGKANPSSMIEALKLAISLSCT